MEIQSPVDESSSPFNRLPPIPTCTPIQVIENLRSLYAEKNIQGFRDVLDSHSDSSYLRHFEIRDLDTVMIDAIRQDNTRFTTELLCRGLPLVPDYVLEAAKFKAKRVLELFFEKGWNINSPISQAQPPVLSYVTQDEDLTTWLLDRGADPNQQCAIDLTPLSYAIRYAPISIIGLLLRRGGNVQQGQLLFHALERESRVIEVLQLLLQEGAPLSTTMYQNHYPSWRLYYFMGLGTVLHKAAELGHLEAVRFLLREGIDLSIKDANGRTALECAKMLNKVEVVDVLEEAAGS